jgi:prolyl oligopeptidase PreP (S9A serine peptidase family)
MYCPSRCGGLLYNLWKDADHPRGIWRRTTLDSFRTPNPDWTILLDVDALAAGENEDWVWQGASTLPPDHERAILRLSRGGSDAVALREFDFVARQFVTDGFVLPEANGGVGWLDHDTVLLCTAWAAPPRPAMERQSHQRADQHRWHLRGHASFRGRAGNTKIHGTITTIVGCVARAGWLSYRPERLAGHLRQAAPCRTESWHRDYRGDGQFPGEPP